MLQSSTFCVLFLVVASARHVSSDVQPAVYTEDDSGLNVNRDGETITITPAQTYAIFCAGDHYNKRWYRVIDQSESSITRLSRENNLPDVYAINTHGNTLTLQFRPFQSTHAGEYECAFTSNGRTLTPLSIFLTPTPPPRLSKVRNVTVTTTTQGSSPALRVSWSAVSGGGITYTVCYSTTDGARFNPPSNANCGTSEITGTTLGPLTRGATYYIWVAAVSSGGRGPYSKRISAVVQQRIYTNDAAEGTVDLEDGTTLMITPSRTYDIVCSDTHAKNWYRVRDESSISRTGQYTESLPGVYATTTGGNALTLHVESFRSTDIGEYECRLSPDGLNLPTLSVFLTPTPPPHPKVEGVIITNTVQGSSPALNVSWSTVNGSGITYTVCYSTTSGTQSDPPSNANCGTSGITGTSTTLGPLSRGTTYYIWVVAVSSGGQGPYSDRRQSITYNVPGPVTSLQVRPSTTIFGLIITWGPPSGSNYPTPVTYQLRYRERPSSGSAGGWSSTVQRTATQSQYTTPVLKPGTRYEVEVWTVSGVGNGQSISRTASTLKLPGPVTSLQVRPSTALFGLIITWGPPSGSNYPTPVTYRLRYRERPSSGSPGGWTRTVQRTATQRQYTTPVLKPGTRYEVEIWAVSSIGRGPSVTRIATTYQIPGQVTSLQVRTSTTIFVLIITWGPPSGSNYPTPVTYRLRYRERPSSGPPGGWSSTVQRTATQRQYTTSVLKPGTRYEVEVWAFASRRSGPVSAMVGTTASGAVQALIVKLNGTQFALVVTWRPPSDITNPTGYRLRYHKATSSTWSSTRTVGPQQTQYTITDLEEDSSYEVEVWATVYRGEGIRKRVSARTSVSGPVESLISELVPLSNGSVRINWQGPTNSNGRILGYEVTYGPIGGEERALNTSTESIILTDLRSEVPFRVVVRARTSEGFGDRAAIVVFSREGVPTKPVGSVKANWNSDSSVLLSWQPLSHTEAKGFPLYIVSYKSVDGSSRGSVSTTSSSVVITGLNSNVIYIFFIQVTTEKGKNEGDTEYILLNASANDNIAVIWEHQDRLHRKK